MRLNCYHPLLAVKRHDVLQRHGPIQMRKLHSFRPGCGILGALPKVMPSSLAAAYTEHCTFAINCCQIVSHCFSPALGGAY